MLATAATVIASQAVISGAFSIASQATKLGFSAAHADGYTSEDQAGRIYMPLIIFTLLFVVDRAGDRLWQFIESSRCILDLPVASTIVDYDPRRVNIIAHF